jgi:porphobilinogen deaminase
MKRDKFIVGTRGSKLALIYTEKVTKFLKNVSSADIEIKKIVTSGDENHWRERLILKKN